MADNKVDLELNGKVKFDEKQVEQELKKVFGNNVSKFIQDAFSRKNSGDKFWFKDIKVPKNATMRQLEQYQSLLKLSRSQINLSSQDPKRARLTDDQRDAINAAKEQKKAYEAITEAINKKRDAQEADIKAAKKEEARKQRKIDDAAFEASERAKREQEKAAKKQRKAEEDAEVAKWQKNLSDAKKYIKAQADAEEKIRNQKVRDEVKDIMNNGRNEMAQEEYKQLVAQYKELEKLGNRKNGEALVREKYSTFKKDFAPREKFRDAMSRAQDLAAFAPEGLQDFIFKAFSKLNVVTDQLSKFNARAKETVPVVGSVESAVGKLANKFMDFASAKADKAGEKIDEFGAALKKLPHTALTKILSGLKSVAKAGLRLPIAMIGKFGDGIKRTAGKVSTFGKQFIRMFRFRVLRQLITRILALIREGFKNLNGYSQMMGTPFHQNVIRLQTSLVYLKNAFAAMVGPIVNAVTPALERLMDVIANLANHVGAFFAALTGQSQFSAAIKKTVSDAQGAAGKMKDLFGFDDLNRLSGDSGSASDWEGAFEEWDPEGDVFGKLKQFVENEQWEELGTEIGGKLNELVEGFDSEALGSSIAGKINAGIGVAHGLITETNFSALGEKIAGFLNGLFDIDTETLGKTISGVITGLFDFAIGFLETLDWGKFASSISNLFGGALEGMTSWLNEKDWDSIGMNLSEGIVDFIAGANIPETLKKVLNFFIALGKGIIKLVVGIFKGIWNGVVDNLFSQIPAWMFTALGLNKEETLIKMKFKSTSDNETKRGENLVEGTPHDVKVNVTTTPKEEPKWLAPQLDNGGWTIPVSLSPNEGSFTNTKTRFDTGRTQLAGVFKDPIFAPVATKVDTGSEKKSVLESIVGVIDWVAPKIPNMGILSTINAPKNISNIISSVQTSFDKQPEKIPTQVKAPTNTSTVKTNTQKTVDAYSPVGFKTSLKTISNNKATRDASQKTVDGLATVKFNSGLGPITNQSSTRSKAQDNVSKLALIAFGTKLLTPSNQSSAKSSAQANVNKLAAIVFGTSMKTPSNGSSARSAAQVAVGKLSSIIFSTALSALTGFSTILNNGQGVINGLNPLTFWATIGTQGLGSILANAWEGMQRGLNANPLVFAATVGATSASELSIANAKNNLTIRSFASGGAVPNKGQLIHVNEAGPEVIANLGHSTGIMNVNQMQEAVAAGNIDVINAIYGMANMVVNAVNSKDLDVYMDSAKVGQSVTNYQNNQMRRGVAY